MPRVREYVARDINQIVARNDLADVVEGLIGDCAGPGSVYDTTRQQLSSYGWDHWADLDPDEGAAEHRPGSVVRLAHAAFDLAGKPPAGPVLDLGCAVGRVTFTAAERVDGLVLGVDLNFAMLQLASRVLRLGRVRYPRRRGGLAYDRRKFAVAMPGADRIDFWACDVSTLPFRRRRSAGGAVACASP